MKFFILLIGLICFHLSQAQYTIEVLDSNTFSLGEGVVLSKTSFRGLSVVDDNTIWVSGSRGTIARSIDGGKTFTFRQLRNYPKSDFRDIEAFDDKRAIIMSSGTPAYILKTVDGGQTWKEVYKNLDTAYFLDAMDFWDDKRGMLVGDPINGHFVLMQTNDGGETWKELDTTKTPRAMQGEAVFAASGTSLRCWGRKEVAFVTGGSISRFIERKSKTEWRGDTLPMSNGTSSSGCFTFALNGTKYFAGGDYRSDTITRAIFYTFSDLSSMRRSETSLGYVSGIEVFSNLKGKPYGHYYLIATGTTGVYVGHNLCTFIDVGLFFSRVSSDPFHVVRKAKKGKAVFLAGPKGKIGRLKY